MFHIVAIQKKKTASLGGSGTPELKTVPVKKTLKIIGLHLHLMMNIRRITATRLKSKVQQSTHGIPLPADKRQGVHAPNSKTQNLNYGTKSTRGQLGQLQPGLKPTAAVHEVVMTAL
jgi:hypothetical protein